jgi:hypothetical protein
MLPWVPPRFAGGKYGIQAAAKGMQDLGQVKKGTREEYR